MTESESPSTLRDGRYAIVRLLGEGGQASTFEGVDKKDGRLVAIKRFRVRGAKSWKEVELAEREAHVLAGIDHPHLPRYVEHFEEGGELYLVTEKIEGENLASLKKQGKKLSEEDVLRLLHEASDTLDYLHGRAPPIIHRDLKPSNVILRPDGSFSFIDFGSVRDKLKPEGGSTVVGTFGYMAPEQFQGRAMPASDVYAIGATALTLLTGREPEDLPHKGLAIDVEAALRGQRTSPELVELLRAMLRPDPDERPARIAPLLVERFERPPPPPPRKQSKRERRREERERRREAREERRRGFDGSDESWEKTWQSNDAAIEAQFTRWRKQRGGPPLPPPFMIIATIALTLVQVGVTIALRVVLPIVLTLLSVVFGKGMREAARQVSRAGEVAGETIGRVRDSLNRHNAGPEPPPRMRVDVPEDPASVHVRFADETPDAEEEALAEEEFEEPKKKSARRS